MMKIFYLLMACSLLNQAVFCQQPAAVPENFPALNWLVGTWTRTNAKAGNSGSERWLKVADKELKGWGVTLKGADTVFLEKLHLVAKGNQLFYVAETTGNKEATWFTVTQLSANSFECENPAHDFPKKISYSLQGKTLTATIAGNGKSVIYIFEKQ